MANLAPRLTSEAFNDLTLLAVGTPCTVILTLSAYALAPLASTSRPETLVALGLGVAVAVVLAWNILWILIAAIAGASHAPAVLTRPLALAIAICGTQRARRLLARGTAGIAVAASIGGCGPFPSTQGPIASPAPATSSFLWTTTSPADSEDLMWHSTDTPPDRSDTTTGETKPPPPSTHIPSPDPAITNPGTTYIVEPGDCLWTIAADALHPDADDAAIATHWRRIHEANLLAVGPNPDLIHPGLTLTMPQEES